MDVLGFLLVFVSATFIPLYIYDIFRKRKFLESNRHCFDWEDYFSRRRLKNKDSARFVIDCLSQYIGVDKKNLRPEMRIDSLNILTPCGDTDVRLFERRISSMYSIDIENKQLTIGDVLFRVDIRMRK